MFLVLGYSRNSWQAVYYWSHVNVAEELLWRNTSTHIRSGVSLGRMPSSINSALTKLLSDPQLPALSARSVCFACTNSQYPNKPDKVDRDVFALFILSLTRRLFRVIITPQLRLSEVSQRITRYYSFLGLVQTRLCYRRHYCLYLHQRANANWTKRRGHKGQHQESSKAKCIKLSYKQTKNSSFPAHAMISETSKLK
jgi:hypothetical protein